MKAPKLQKGANIAVIAPSGAASFYFPHRVKRGVESLQNLGFKVHLYPTVKKNFHGSAGTALERAQDVNDAFQNKDIKAIISTIGGLTLNEVLPFIDYGLVRNNPKIFCGYSDNTLLHCALATQSDLVSFYGPCVMTQFGEFPQTLGYTTDWFLKALTKNEPIGQVFPAKYYTDEILDWSTRSDLTRARKLKENQGYICIKKGLTKGLSLIGCVPSLISLIGTKFIPDFSRKVLFIEFPEGQEFGRGYPLSYVNSDLATLRLAGVFDKIEGLVVGRPYRYESQEDVDEFHAIIKRQTEGFSFPILANFDFGHSDPILTIPYNTLVEINAEEKNVTFLDTGVI